MNTLTARGMVLDQEILFISDYVPASPLSEYLVDGTLSRDQVATVIDGIATALDAARLQGLPHLNLKPTNVLIATARGSLKVYVTDFGMARQTWSHVAMEVGEALPSDLLYVAPEQFSGHSHARSDIYSLGVIACALLGGLDGVATPNPGTLLWAHANGMPVETLKLDIFPDHLASVLASALARSPDDRPPSSTEFSEYLAEALIPEPGRLPAPVATLPRASDSRIGDSGTPPVTGVEILAIAVPAALVSFVVTVVVLRLVGLT
jgi:serine/threonine-protein kinase